MTSKNDGGPAFPIPQQAMFGMTLRDWFAGQALTGILAFPGAVNNNREKSAAAVVSVAYDYADAMLKERQK